MMTTRSRWRRALRSGAQASALLVAVGAAAACGRQSTPPPSTRAAAASAGSDSIEAGRAALLAEVRHELAAMRETRYTHATDVDEAKGRFFYDCSGFVDYALKRARPADLRALPVTTSVRPLAEDFERYFRQLSDGTAGDGAWRAVATVDALRPGDVIAWLHSGQPRTGDTGHVLVVLEPPVRDARIADAWLVKVADSTEPPVHSGDSRPEGAEGLGTGTIGLAADGSGRPVGFYWKGGVPGTFKRTDVALGQPA